MKLAKNAGARKAIELNVSGAFHSTLMEPAKEKLAGTLQLQTLNKPDFPVVMNVTAKPTEDPDEIRQNLLAQLDSPVLWTDTVEAIRDAGISEMVEVGQGRTLQGLVKRIDKSIATRGVSKITDIKEYAHA
jgi:[acyl-carrier-protein] S-malonyltransferase